ncbi:hephaestin-like 1 [Apophysomyces sp. BC1034]|nr:hephaestin-like 1 [Apophysomyces sp. BC1015]KAG0183586.1 hephaestin-like 1 [Apophysomyces sp. BC1021]KAG0183634.1 hephaestin-like 1 [Apophysomyces sp. BC1021]KAG0194892.1 hephaestin-like 1 [Apophysomyces sp. BC1034]
MRVRHSASLRPVLLSYFLLLLWAGLSLAAPVNPKIRHYYITAEEIDWDYAPMQWDNMQDKPLNETAAALYTVRTSTRIGSVYKKVRYRQYSDPDFYNPIVHDPMFGMMGPIIRAEAGDQVQVLFFNRASKPFSLHPHSTNWTDTHLPGTSVAPGAKFQYVWDIPSDFDFPVNQSSVLWTYLSRDDPARDLNSGLLGPIIIYQSGTLVLPTPGSMFEKPEGIDQEVITIMLTTDEGQSKYLVDSANAAGIDNTTLNRLTQDPDFLESNRMYHVNGYVYNNNAEIRVFYGERVRWYVVAFGLTDDDMHTAHWHGGTLLHRGHRVDVVDLTPVSFEVLDMIPDNEGQWLFHCHIASHFISGMTAFYEVEKPEYTGDEGW